MALLVNLTTNLKSLKYGGDRPGNGNSGQPYIAKSKIPEGLTSKSPDFLLRNGYLTPVNAAEDVVRLGKMFFDLKSPNGILFTAKQNLLSRTAVPANYTPEVGNNPKLLNEGVYTPLSTLAQAGVVAFGSHLNKQGLNPFEETGAYSKNPNLYFNKVRANNVASLNSITNQEIVTEADTITIPGTITIGTPENPGGFFTEKSDNSFIYSNFLQVLRDDNIIQEAFSFTSNAQFSNRLAKLWYDKIYNKDNDPILLSYPGGPGSILGIGKTNIKFAGDQRTGKNSTKVNIGKSTWTPNQYIDRSFATLIGKETAIGASKAYATTNQLALDSDVVDGTRVYASKVGPDAKLFNPLAIGSVTWTPNLSEQNNPDRSRRFLDILLNKATGITNRYYETNGIELLTIGNLPTDGNYVYESGSAVGLNAKLFNTNATGPVTWTPVIQQESLDSTTKLDKLRSQAPITKKFNTLLSGSSDKISDPLLSPPSVYKLGNDNKPTLLNNNDEILYANGSATYTQKQIEESPYGEGENNTGKKTGAPKLQDFRRIIRDSTLPDIPREAATKNGSLAESLDYTNQNYEKRVNIGGKDYAGPGNNTSGKNLSKGLLTSSGIGPIDKINALPLYRSEKIDPKQPTNDLIQFRIAAIENNNPKFNTYIHFRAFIDSFDDSYTANWDSVKYAGRGENFYNYNGFDRNISLSFTVAAQSLEELQPMYKKLNYLASNLTPDYSEYGYMRGPLIKLTVGNYLYEQVGFIKNLSYSVPSESPWDAKNEMPFIIKVNSFGFIPIHSFRPQKQQIGIKDFCLYNFNEPGVVKTFGDQRYIYYE